MNTDAPIDKLMEQNAALKELLRSLIIDVEAMECEKPSDFSEDGKDYEKHWYGGFPAWGKETDDYDNDNAVIQWPCLGILMEKAKELLK